MMKRLLINLTMMLVVLSGCTDFEKTYDIEIPIPLSLLEGPIKQKLDEAGLSDTPLYWDGDRPVEITLSDWEPARGQGFSYIVEVDLDLKASVDYAFNPNVDFKVYFEPKCEDGHFKMEYIDYELSVDTPGWKELWPVNAGVDLIADVAIHYFDETIEREIQNQLKGLLEKTETVVCQGISFEDDRTMVIGFGDLTIVKDGGDMEIDSNIGDEPTPVVQNGEFINVWQNELIDNETDQMGMLIHSTFVVHNVRHYDCSANAYFEFSNGQKLRDSNNILASNSGQVSVSDRFTPEFEHNQVNDFTLFMPYDELELANGTHSLRFVMQVFCDGKFMAESDYVYFDLTRWD